MKQRTPLTELLEEDSGYRVFGAETLSSRIHDLEAQIEGAKRAEDIEYVHKLRVASRRVRTALNIFNEFFPTKQVNAWRKAVKNVTTSCGEARDTDVQLAFLQNYATHLDSLAAEGVRSLIAMQQARRTRMQSDIVKALNALQTSEALSKIKYACEAIKNKANPRRINTKTILTYKKAEAHIAERLDEFLTLGEFVHDPTAVTKHHKLRIAAKRLRYTMEIFSPIYTSGLNDNIALMKQFQNLLGEMHDYYVWAQDLTAYGPAISSEARYGLGRLLAHLKELWGARYGNFVTSWDEAVGKHLFTKIMRETDAGLNSGVLRDVLAHTKRVALISDIHANVDALEVVLEDAKRSGLELFLNAGDAVGFGIYPTQVVETLRSPVFLSVVGNVDLETLEEMHHKPSESTGDAGVSAVGGLSPTDAAYLQSLPKQLRLEICGMKVLVTHGSPASVDEHIYPDAPERRLRQFAAEASADLIITGHTHLQMNRDVDGVRFLNPGSVGRPVDGDPRAEYAVLNFDPLTVEFRRVEYDVETLADEVRRLLPESYAQVLLRGLKLETIRKQDNSLAKKRLWRNRSTTRLVKEVASIYPSDPIHAEQDRKIALELFDGTKSLHLLGAEERYWLECAAILHDVGISRGAKGHHKSSLRIILDDPNLPFTMKERYIVGSIARYHRKALPDGQDFNLARLSEAERRKVVALSAILRVADALDASHDSIVKRVNVKSFPHHLLLECLASGESAVESQAVRKKKDLFEGVFKRDLVVVWKPKRLVEESPRSPLAKSASESS